MFAAVAPRYDLLNRVLSGWLDTRWRRCTAAALSAAERRRVLDLCCGTGDLAVSLARRGGRVQAADFCLPMLLLARPKRARLPGPRPALDLLAADALDLPFSSGSFSAATVAFGVRNVADLDRCLRELVRVLAPGGRLLVLEFAVPRHRLLRAAYLFYFRHVLPRIGALLSPRGSAYGYLPASVLEFPQRSAFAERMAAAGLESTAFQDWTGGIVCLYSGRKP
jgi:demethylmenaquinone methyltransferase/2-methoxy-6-polyprenyl-1,4-benzoquinol methylase